MKRKKRRGLKIIVSLVVIAAVAVGGLYAYQRFFPQESNASAVSLGNHTVSRMSFTVDVSGNGALLPTRTQSVKAPFDAEVASVLAKSGDVVSAGDVILTLDPQSILDEIAALEAEILAKDKEIASSGGSSSGGKITAPVAGIIKEIYAKKEDDVKNRMSQSGAMCVLSTDGRMRLTFYPAEGYEIKLSSSLRAVMEIDGETVEVECVIESIDADGKVTLTIEDDEYPVGQMADIVNLDDSVVGEGALTINRPVYVVGDYGTVSEVRYEVEDSVSKGTTIFKLTGTLITETLDTLILEREALVDDLEAAKDKLNNLEWVAPEDGVITDISLSAGDSVSEKSALYTLQNNDEFQIVIDIDELDITSVELGQNATVTVPALDNAEYEATVTHISSSGYTESSVTTYEVTLLMNKTDNVRSGMNAEANVQTISRQNVLVVPAAAIQSINGQKFVQLVNGEEATLTPVEVGASNGTYVEILSGLSEGDRIVSGSTSSSTGGAGGMGMMMSGDFSMTMPSGVESFSGGGSFSGERGSGGRPAN